MATAANTAAPSASASRFPSAAAFSRLIPGLLLLTAVRLRRQVHRAVHRLLHQVPPHHVSQYRIRAMGHRHRPPHLQHRRRAAASFSPASPPTSSGSRPASCCSARASSSETSCISAASRLLSSPLRSRCRSPSCTSSGAPSNSSPSSPRCSPSGSSICGVSAIIAAKPAIEADDEDALRRHRRHLALGAISLFTFPLIGHSLHLSDKAYGLWTGLAVDNTAEATAAGALYSDAAGKVAVLAKTTRNALIGFIVLGYALYWASQGQAQAIGNKAEFLWRKFPKFVLGFLLISLLATLSFFHQAAARQRRQPLALGLPAHLRRRRPPHQLPRTGQTGLASLRRRSIGEIFIAILTLGLVYGADRFLHL